MNFLVGLFIAGLSFHTGPNHRLKVFEPLVNNTWIAEGVWADGSSFYQEISYYFDLEKSIVIANTRSYTSSDTNTIGNRNHGVRQFDSSTNTIRFWEFDRFGGLTEGTVEANHNDIIYQYPYKNIKLTEYWQYKNDSTYHYTIGVRENKTWTSKYLETDFKLKK